MKTSYLAILVLLFISCGSDDDRNTANCRTEDYTERNEQEIQDYLEANDLEAEKTDTGLYYIIEEEGTGAQPSSTNTVRVAYKGYYTNGNVFDESEAEGIEFPLQNVIPGWTEGITYFKEGGSGKLIIPSRLGYKSCGNASIPGGSVLVFDIELLEVLNN